MNDFKEQDQLQDLIKIINFKQQPGSYYCTYVRSNKARYYKKFNRKEIHNE